MNQKYWSGITLALSLALVAAILLLPPWSPLSLTSQEAPAPETAIPSEKPFAPASGGAAIRTLPGQDLEVVAWPPPKSPNKREGAAVPQPKPLVSGADAANLKEPYEVSRGRVSKIGQYHASPPAIERPDVAVSMRPVTEPDSARLDTTPDTYGDPGSPSLEDLLQATEDPVWKVRWDAVNALGVLKDPRGIPALVERALYDDNPHPRWRSLWAISSVDSEIALPTLRAALQGEDPAVVRNAAVALAFFGQPEARPELLRGLDDPDSFRRWEAVFSLKKVGDAEVVTELIMLLELGTEPEARVRQEAVLVLSAMSDERVAPALLFSLLDDPSPQVRWRAAMGISRLGDPSSLDSLEQAQITETNLEVLKWIEEAITKSQ